MTITWGRLRRRNDRDEQAAGTGVDAHDSSASVKRRERQEELLERQKRRQEIEDERARGDSPMMHFWDFPTGN